MSPVLAERSARSRRTWVAICALAGACTAPIYEDEPPVTGPRTRDAGQPLDATPDEAEPENPDLAAFCGDPIEPVLEVVDADGRAFSRDAAGLFLVPITARTMGLDTGRSANVTGRRMRYTFRSGCYPTVTVQAPVLVGLSLDGFWLDRRCELAVEIFDAGCPEARLGRATGQFVMVP